MTAGEARTGRSRLFYVLLGTCLGIWGYVFYQVTEGVAGTEEPVDTRPLGPPAEEATPAPRRPAPAPAYAADFRDPFERPPGLTDSPAPAAPSPKPSTPPAPAPPRLALRGVVDATALLHAADGTVYVAGAGERAGEAEVVRVQRDHVVVRFQGHAFTLHLAR